VFYAVRPSAAFWVWVTDHGRRTAVEQKKYGPTENCVQKVKAAPAEISELLRAGREDNCVMDVHVCVRDKNRGGPRIARLYSASNADARRTPVSENAVHVGDRLQGRAPELRNHEYPAQIDIRQAARPGQMRLGLLISI